MQSLDLRDDLPIPQTPAPIVRARLLRHLDAAARGPLTLVAAAEGRGKSVLLEQWVATRADVASVRSFSGVRKPHELASALDELQSVIDGGTESILVLDDVDTVLEGPQRDDLLHLLAHALSHVHLVVATRLERNFRDLARELALQSSVAFLRDTDLEFTHDEARELLGAASGRRLDDADVDALVARTEGWAMGLRLAALALRGADDVANCVERFGGTDPYVASYFDEQMRRSSASLRQFLLTTSVLERLTGSLCDSLVGVDDGAAVLHALAEQSVLVPTGPNDTWYRHHRLLREYLSDRFHTEDPPGARRALHRAARWHMEHEDPAEAVRYLTAAEDWDGVLDVVEAASRSLFEQAKPAVPLAWLEGVPRAVRAARPDVALAHTMLLTMVGDTLGAEDVLRELGEPSSLSPGEEATAAVLRSMWIETHLGPDAAMEAADRALAILRTAPPDTLPDPLGMTSRRKQYVIAQGSRARALWYRGDVAAARAGFRDLLDDGDVYPSWHINVLGTVALLEAWSGMLGRAERDATASVRVATECQFSDAHSNLVNAYLAIAHGFMARDDLDRAELVLNDAVDAATLSARRPVPLAMCAIERARLELARGRPRAALESLREPETTTTALPPLVGDHLHALKAHALLDIGEPGLAERELHECATSRNAEVAAAAVRVAVARDDVVSAQRALVAWPDDGELRSTMLHALARALVEEAQGDRREALADIDEVLAAAEPEGHVSLFLTAGPTVQRLLRARFHTNPTPFLRRLVRPDQAAPIVATTARPATGEIAPILSARELGVLRYLPSRMTHAEIAAELFVSRNTVKSHVHSIYAKLGARGRRDAINRAEDLGLL